MVRNLYRFYLYTVFIALFIFIAVAVGQLLSTLLSFTALRGSSGTVSSQAEVIQSTVFVLVAVLIAGALGGLHYWLIRRDIRNDPVAGTDAIRSFFLNIAEAIGISLAVPIVGFVVIGTLARSPEANVVAPAAFALPTLALVLILEAERRRTPITSGVALAFQRLHFYGVQVILLIYLTFSWLSTIRPLVDSLLFGGRGALEACPDAGSCPNYNVLLLALSVLWFVACFVGYGLIVRNDKSALLRLILQGGGLAYGVGSILLGLQQGIELLLFPLFKVPVSYKDVLGPFAGYDFVSPLTLGVLVAALYYWWLRLASRQGLIGQRVLALTVYAIVTVLAAAAFWWGVGNLLYNLFQSLNPVPSTPDALSWASSSAFALVGVGYIGLDFYLRRQNAIDPSAAAGPRRGYVFALLGGGILSLAVGGAMALYAWATSLFGTSISNWQQVTHVGLAAGIVGAFLLGFYLWTARRESLFSGLGKRPVPTLPTPPDESNPVHGTTIEGILDELLAGKLTRDEAVGRIRALTGELSRSEGPSGA